MLSTFYQRWKDVFKECVYPNTVRQVNSILRYTTGQYIALFVPDKPSMPEVAYHFSSCSQYTVFLIAGQSHLIYSIQNTLEIVVVPASLETLGMDANTRRVFLPQQIQAHMA
jgi:hypothetical protein